MMGNSQSGHPAVMNRQDYIRRTWVFGFGSASFALQGKASYPFSPPPQIPAPVAGEG